MLFCCPSTLRTVLMSCLLISLTACGGGGGGGGSNSTPPGGGGTTPPIGGGTTPPDPGDGTTPPDPGDGTTPPDEPSTLSINVNPQALMFKTFVSTAYDPQTLPLNVTFQGDGVLIGYAQGVSAPSWISIPQNTINAPTGQFSIDVSALPQMVGPGTYTTSLRLQTGNLSTGESAYIDVPVQLALMAPPPVYSGNVTFSAATTDAGLPAHQNIVLDFGIFTNPTFNVTLEDDNSVASTWLTATPSVSNRTINVGVLASRPIGHYRANLIVHYQASGASGTKKIPVAFDVHAGAPLINYVLPEAVYDNAVTEVTIRGAGFDLSTVQDVKLGSQSAISFQVISATEITATLAQPSNLGTQSLQIVMAAPQPSPTYSMLVKQPPQSVAGNLNMVEASNVVRFDMLRDTIIVAGPNTVFRVQLVSGSWQVVSQRILSIGSFDLSPDSRHIVYADGPVVKLIDAVTLQDAASYALPDRGVIPPPGPIYIVKEILNNGDIQMILGGYNNSDLFTFNLTNQIFESANRHNYLPMYRRTIRRDKTFIAAGNSGYGQDFNGYYYAGTSSFVAHALPGPLVYGNQYALSGNGSKLLLNNNIYDTNFTLLGTFADNSIAGSSELSPDGNTVYKVDAGAGALRAYDLNTAPPYTPIGNTTFPSYVYYAAGPDTLVTPDGRMMILSRGYINASTSETRVTIVPLP